MKKFLMITLLLVGAQSIAQEYACPILATLNYGQKITGTILPSSGTSIALGLNPPGWFSGKFALGPMVEVRGFKVGGANRQYGKMAGAVNQYLLPHSANQADSSITSVLSRAFNKTSPHTFFGNYFASWGVFFSPFPYSHGGIMIQVKTGTYGYPIEGGYNHPHLENGDSDYLYMDMPVKSQVQLTCKPLRFFKSINEEYEYGEWVDGLHISVYADHVNFRHARVQNKDIKKYFDPAMFEQYNKEWQFGLKISVGAY